MSTEAPAAGSRKDKRAQRDAERAAKFRSRSKKEPAEPAALPGDDNDETAQEAVPTAQDVKASKKRKRVDEATADPVDKPDDAQVAKSSKKRKASAPVDGEESTSRKKFIVFVGNLPFSTTDQSLERHFEKLKPFSLRHRTDPKTKKSKGFAFIEFENYDRLKTCLKIYHHTYFDPEDPNAQDPEDDPQANSRTRQKAKGRRINVALSAGGGGNTEARKEKIKAKNERLDGQRQRRMEAERKGKEKKRKAQGDSAPAKDDKSSKHERVDKALADTAMGGMHPSRLARIR